MNNFIKINVIKAFLSILLSAIFILLPITKNNYCYAETQANQVIQQIQSDENFYNSLRQNIHAQEIKGLPWGDMYWARFPVALLFGWVPGFNYHLLGRNDIFEPIIQIGGLILGATFMWGIGYLMLLVYPILGYLYISFLGSINLGAIPLTLFTSWLATIFNSYNKNPEKLWIEKNTAYILGPSMFPSVLTGLETGYKTGNKSNSGIYTGLTGIIKAPLYIVDWGIQYGFYGVSYSIDKGFDNFLVFTTPLELILSYNMINDQGDILASPYIFAGNEFIYGFASNKPLFEAINPSIGIGLQISNVNFKVKVINFQQISFGINMFMGTATAAKK